MHSTLSTVAVAVVAFAGTMVDNFAALIAQLAITDRARRPRATFGHFVGMLALIMISVVVASALSEIPLAWVGVLAALPIALGIHAWRTRDRPAHLVRRGFFTTLAITIALGGDNLAVWIPMLRAAGITEGAVTVGVFIVCDVIMLVIARLVASHPRVVATGSRIAPIATPFLYFFLALVILWECGWI